MRALTKRYRETVAVDDISFEAPAGSAFAFLGTNGAGKSTTISRLTTVLEPDVGELTVVSITQNAPGLTEDDVARRSRASTG